MTIDITKAYQTAADYGDLFERPDWAEAMERFIPGHMHGGIVRYIAHGIEPGDFLSAVIRNDLMDAVSKADETNAACLNEYAVFFYNYAPSFCCGGSDAVAALCEAGGIVGIAKTEAGQ